MGHVQLQAAVQIPAVIAARQPAQIMMDAVQADALI
jgi:hypothetical protein